MLDRKIHRQLALRDAHHGAQILVKVELLGRQVELRLGDHKRVIPVNDGRGALRGGIVNPRRLADGGGVYFCCHLILIDR